jgi:hypothetical protein
MSVYCPASRGQACPATGHRERLLLPVPAEVLADAGAEASLFHDLQGGGVPEQAGSLRRHRGSRDRVNPGPDSLPAGAFGLCESAEADLS